LSSYPDITQLLSQAHTIAAVGLSDNPRDESYAVGKYQQSQGYKVIPVNPRIEISLGHKAVDSILSIQEHVDVVHVMKESKNVVQTVVDAAQAGAQAIWFEPGAATAEATMKAQEQGLATVTDKHFRIEHQKRLGKAPL